MANPNKYGSDGSFPGNVGARQVVIAILVVLAVWFVLANTGSVRVRFWIPIIEAPLWIALAGTFLGGWVVGWLVRARRN